MFIKTVERKTKSGDISQSFRIVESIRKGARVQQKTVRFVGSSSDPKMIKVLEKTAEDLRVQLENERQPTFLGMEKAVYSREPEYIVQKPHSHKKNQNNKQLKISQKIKRKAGQKKSLFALHNPSEKKRVQYGIKGVCGAVYDQLKFNTLIQGTTKDEQWNEILKLCVLSRIAHPDSKLQTVNTLKEDFDEEIPLEKMYRTMDKLYPHIEKVKSLVAQNTLSLFNQDVDILFFDVTTIYFESFKDDDFRQSGYSKDGKFKETQVVLALITNQQGHPLSYELFRGKTSEGKTLTAVVQQLKKKFKVHKAVLVADRAMFIDKNLQFMEEQGIQYVVAAKLKSLPKTKRNQVIYSNDKRMTVIRNEVHWIKELEHKGRRLVVSHSNKRAQKDQADRKRLIDRLLKKVKDKQIPIKSLIPNYGTKRYVTVEKTKVTLNEQKIKEESLWDGFHGIITNIEDQTAKELLSRYRQLWRIEEAFRVCKHTLKMRPIYHWKKRRIKSHIALCFLAYSLSYTMKYRMERRGLTFSIKQMRKILTKDQYSVIEDEKTQKEYRMPSTNTEPIQAIYQAFGIKRISHLTRIS